MKWFHVSGVLGALLLVVGHGWGLKFAPSEAMMGDVGRILYVHVPTAWVALVVYLVAFGAAIWALWSDTSAKAEATTVAACEVGIVLNALLCFQGAMWAKPTWGTYWTWDPRLTTTAIMILSYAGLLVLRNLVSNPNLRRIVTGVGAILAFVNVPIVYLSTTWWNSLHQPLSSPDTVSTTMHWPLRIAAFGMLFISIAFIAARAHSEANRVLNERTAPDLPDSQAPLELGAR
jgi:heme exporter protein C